LDFNKGISILEMHGTNIKKNYGLILAYNHFSLNMQTVVKDLKGTL
jgi:hypothetical protein